MSGKRIEDYALIGDGETAALVHRDGAIEWLCMPRFDSEACFAALLGEHDNGCWRMQPEDGTVRSNRRYIDETLILETEFETANGLVAVIDFMPVRGEAPDIVRIVEGRRGRVAMRSELAVRFDYGQIHPLVQPCSDDRLLAIAGPDAILLAFDVPIHFEDRWFTSRFTVAEGERLGFVMTWFSSHDDQPQHVDPERALRQTRDYWRKWVSACRYQGACRGSVVRSLITLKALIHRPTGGMVAAPTASLPERAGGGRNWDYRFCWLRDSTFTLLALLQAGMREEAEGWVEWLRRAVAGEPINLQPFYTVDGGRRALEWTADWLPGFDGARPVRFGNAAVAQCQLDIYGEVIETLFFALSHGLPRREEADRLIRLLAQRLEEIWDQPDAGIWEQRGEPRHHVYSKAMCWAGFDRAARLFQKDEAKAAQHCRSLAELVKAQIFEQGFDRDRNSFVAAYGEKALDASVLRLPLVGLLPASDPRMGGTVVAIERELVRDGLVHRYATQETDDGIAGDEGAFLAASFWLADVYALQGRAAEAHALFERLCGLTNDVGLLSEEYGERGMLGNFPQGLSHLSLVSTAMNLGGRGGPVHERTG